MLQLRVEALRSLLIEFSIIEEILRSLGHILLDFLNELLARVNLESVVRLDLFLKGADVAITNGLSA